MAELEHVDVRTNGVRLHVVLAGPKDGRPIVLLHGFPEFWAGWRKQIPVLAQAGYRVIVPDQRGYNLSDVPKDVSAYAFPELASDVIGLLDHFGIEQVDLVGHDWGAAVAWGVALAFPQRVRKLAILNVPHPVVFLRHLTGNPLQLMRSWYIWVFQMRGVAEWIFGSNNFRGAIGMLKSSSLPSTFSQEDLDAYRQAYTNSGGLTGMINWYRAMLSNRPAPPPNNRISMPTLIQWGKKDAALGEVMASESLELCDQGRLIFYDNATHWLQHDEPDAVNKELLAFFA